MRDNRRNKKYLDRIRRRIATSPHSHRRVGIGQWLDAMPSAKKATNFSEGNPYQKDFATLLSQRSPSDAIRRLLSVCFDKIKSVLTK